MTFSSLGLHVQAADCAVRHFCRGTRGSLFIRRLLLICCSTRGSLFIHRLLLIGGFRRSYPGCFRRLVLVGLLGRCHLLRWGILLCRWNTGRLIRLHAFCRDRAGT